MFRNFLKNNKAQNTAEYALLIALVVAGIIAMQTYAQRALQARVRDASVFMATSPQSRAGGTTAGVSIGDTVQYEPYYQQSNYDVTRDSRENTRLGEGLVAKESGSERTRTGNQVSRYGADAPGSDTTVGEQAMPEGL